MYTAKLVDEFGPELALVSGLYLSKIGDEHGEAGEEFSSLCFREL